jgi:murein DD-endopeptidase MepM/ murein hydrolase activator NlpD
MSRWPTAPYTTRRTGCYGCRRLTPADGGCGVKGYPCTHWGVDTFTISGNRDVWAPEDGVVVSVSDGSAPPFSGYGPGIVLMKGASGVYHLLAHLEYGSIRVRVGQPLSEGAPIGRFDANYNHCHYEVRKAPTGPSETNTINPEEWHRSRSGNSTLLLLLAVGGLVAIGVMAARHRVGERFLG